MLVLFYFAAREGLIGKKVQSILVTKVEEKKKEPEKPKEEPKPEPPKIEQPKVEAPKAEAAKTAPCAVLAGFTLPDSETHPFSKDCCRHFFLTPKAAGDGGAPAVDWKSFQRKREVIFQNGIAHVPNAAHRPVPRTTGQHVQWRDRPDHHHQDLSSWAAAADSSAEAALPWVTLSIWPTAELIWVMPLVCSCGHTRKTRCAAWSVVE